MKKIHLYCCNFGNLISSSFAITPQTRIYACELRKPTGFSRDPQTPNKALGWRRGQGSGCRQTSGDSDQLFMICGIPF